MDCCMAAFQLLTSNKWNHVKHLKGKKVSQNGAAALAGITPLLQIFVQAGMRTHGIFLTTPTNWIFAATCGIGRQDSTSSINGNTWGTVAVFEWLEMCKRRCVPTFPRPQKYPGPQQDTMKNGRNLSTCDCAALPIALMLSSTAMQWQRRGMCTVRNRWPHSVYDLCLLTNLAALQAVLLLRRRI